VEDFSGSLVSAFRCVEFWNADGGTCGTVETSCQPSSPLCVGGKGLDFIKPPNTNNNFWTNNGQHFAYVGLVLPPKEGGARSRVTSITNTDEVP
jgi:hypothetical protein